ncbi:hypothetical protein [Sphingobacterium sp. LRF_L2]|uniref:hypothetical protein n=1 Tax=Sphingobacterium sp. LRF_L2 TaxID=3369421 RepID=UPI003F646BBE
MKRIKNIAVVILSCLSMQNISQAQEPKIKASLFEGTVAMGYVDKGAYINCTGPAIKYSYAQKKAILMGLLPSLKIKEDKVEPEKPKNAWITPSLGFGITAVFNHIVLQLPTFYSAKTATTDGRWKLGIGLGYKF